MCAEKSSFCEGMGAGSRAKLMGSRQAVGLLAVLADAGNFKTPTFGKQELWRHVVAAAAHTTSSLPLVEDVRRGLSEQAVGRNSPAGELRPRVKKVRFAPDVVEPAGDSRAYRGKNGASILARKEVYTVKQAQKEGCHDRRLSQNGVLKASSEVNSACKAQSLAKPYLPANRMLLYKGKQLSRSMMTLDVSV